MAAPANVIDVANIEVIYSHVILVLKGVSLDVLPGGIVAILDRRIRTRGYGKTLLDSLPPARRTDDLAAVAAFWAEITAARS